MVIVRAEDVTEIWCALEAEFGIPVRKEALEQTRTAGDLHHLLMHEFEHQPAATSDSEELWERLQKLLSAKMQRPVQEISDATPVCSTREGQSCCDA